MDDTGWYRVLDNRDQPDRTYLVDAETGEVASVASTASATLQPGYLVQGVIDWTTDPPHVDVASVGSRTRFSFVRTAEPLFRAARECWAEAEQSGSGMNARVTYGSDAEPNGVVYTFASRARDRFAEFADGRRPLDPLLEQIERIEPPYDVFVIGPHEEPFVVVCIALERDGLLAETVRETYY